MTLYAISKQPFKGGHHYIKEKISLESWQAVVESRPEMIWMENTASGQKLQEWKAINKPNNVSDIKLKHYARAEWYPKGNYYHLQFDFNYVYGYIFVQVDSVITPKRMRYILGVAKDLDALFIKNFRTIVDESYIERYEKKKEEKKMSNKLTKEAQTEEANSDTEQPLHDKD